MRSIVPIIWIIIAFAFLSVLTLQYPLSTTFPIGGDATRYILQLLEVRDLANNGQWAKATEALLTNTYYPGNQIIFGTSSLLPISWPERFTWWMVLGHLFTASSLGLVLYRLQGWQSAATGLAVWGLTTLHLTSHIEDATLAQLWSLGFVALFFYFILNKSWIKAVVMIGLAGLTHPFSGAIILLSLIISIPALLTLRAWKLASVGLGAAILGIILVIRYYDTSLGFVSDSHVFDIADVLKSPFGPFLLLTPVGLVVLVSLIKRFPIPVLLILHFLLISLLLTFNNKLGITILIPRWQSYGVMSLVMLAALALPTITFQAFSSRIMRTLFISILFIASGLYTWDHNAPIFHYYESPSRYGRLHPEEQASIEWMKTNLPPKSVVVSTRTNRHSEWIPILSDHTWIGLKTEDELWHKSATELSHFIQSVPYTHIVFFKHREKSTEVFPAETSVFPTIFENNGAQIIELKKL